MAAEAPGRDSHGVGHSHQASATPDRAPRHHARPVGHVPSMSADEGDAELAALLKEQAEFLKSGKPPAAKVTRVAQLPILNPEAAPAPRPKPKAEDRKAPSSSQPAPPAAPPVVTEIRERKPVVGVVLPTRHPTGFPRARHRSELSADACARLRSSQPASLGTVDGSARRGTRGTALGSSAADEIHSENTSKLAAMSAADIEKERAELLAALAARGAPHHETAGVLSAPPPSAHLSTACPLLPRRGEQQRG